MAKIPCSSSNCDPKSNSDGFVINYCMKLWKLGYKKTPMRKKSL